MGLSANDKLLMERIENDFEYHPPNDEKIKKHEELRRLGGRLAHLINAIVPEGREKSLALTKLEECIMWANAGIARHE